MTIATSNIHEDLHILAKAIDTRGGMSFTRTASGITEYCFMTQDKIHYVIPVKVDADEWRIADTQRGLSVKALTIFDALTTIPDSLEAHEYEAVCIVQFGDNNIPRAFEALDLMLALDEESHDFGVLKSNEGTPWHCEDVLREAN